MSIRIGQGFDIHPLVPSRRLVIGGVEVPSERGLSGHSDGDVLLHAVTDAVLGALGAGDLGTHFPSTDASLEGIASGELLSRAMAMVAQAGYRVVNCDATVIAQEPRLAPHRDAMRDGVAGVLGVEAGRVNVKITSTDRLGAIGRGEGIAATAVILLERDPR